MNISKSTVLFFSISMLSFFLCNAQFKGTPPGQIDPGGNVAPDDYRVRDGQRVVRSVLVESDCLTAETVNNQLNIEINESMNRPGLSLRLYECESMQVIGEGALEATVNINILSIINQSCIEGTESFPINICWELSEIINGIEVVLEQSSSLLNANVCCNGIAGGGE